MISILLPTYNRRALLYNTLDSFDYFYQNEDLEIVIIDDCSKKEEQFPNVQKDFPKLNINHTRIEVKCGYNPSLAYNVAARKANGDIFVLSSPETFHVKNMFRLYDFENINTYDYHIFSVFCLTEKEHKYKLLNQYLPFEQKLNIIKQIELKFEHNLGCNGYSFGNNWGSWYLHETYRPSRLNFLTAMSRDLYYEISGFNEEFMGGTGYDDADFLARLSPNIQNTYWYELTGIHIDHGLAEKSIAQESNRGLFESLQRNQTYIKNNDWGFN